MIIARPSHDGVMFYFFSQLDLQTLCTFSPLPNSHPLRLVSWQWWLRVHPAASRCSLLHSTTSVSHACTHAHTLTLKINDLACFLPSGHPCIGWQLFPDPLWPLRYQGFFYPRQKKNSIKDILAAHRWSPKVLSIGCHITGLRSCCPNSGFLTWCAPPSEGLLSVVKLSSSGMTGVSISNNETFEKNALKGNFRLFS